MHEYYAGSEGNGFCAINSQDWLDHPGSVGVSLLGAVHIVGVDGEELPVGEEGQIYFESPRKFTYHGDPAKTAEAFDDRGWSTIGDIGRIDEDGFLYLTDRASNMIISGGVNIYPREAEDVLIMHPGVADVAVIGMTDADLGERVVAVVQSARELDPGRSLGSRGQSAGILPGAALEVQVSPRGQVRGEPTEVTIGQAPETATRGGPMTDARPVEPRPFPQRPVILATAPLRGPGLRSMESFSTVISDPWIDQLPLRIYNEAQLAQRVTEVGADVVICEADQCTGELLALPLAAIGSTRGDPTNVDVSGATAAGHPGAAGTWTQR